MLKIRFKMLLTICIAILLTMLPKSTSLAGPLYTNVFIDGLEYNLASYKTDEGITYNYANVCDRVIDDEITVIDGVLTLPAKVTYKGEEFIVRHISTLGNLPDFVKEVVIPEDFGTYCSDYEYSCGLMDAKKMTVLADSVIFSTCIETADIPLESWLCTYVDEVYCHLEEVEIQSSRVVVEENFFTDCRALKKITFQPEAEVTLERGAFTRCEQLKSLLLPKKTEFKEGAVIQCENLKEIAFYEKSDKYGFSDDGLVTRTAPKMLLYANTNKSTYQLPKRVEAIGQFAFASCPNLTTVKTTSNLKNISRYAFYKCGKLKNITLKKGLESISSYAFWGCSLTDVTIPETVTHLGEGILWENPKLKTLKVAKGNKKYKSQNNMVLTKSGKTLKMAVGEKNMNVPEGVISIDTDFIAKGKAVSSITYPKTLKTMGMLGDVEVMGECTGTLAGGDLKWEYKYSGVIWDKMTFKGKTSPEVKCTLDYQRSIYHECIGYNVMVIEIPKGADKASYKEFQEFYVGGGKLVTI